MAGAMVSAACSDKRAAGPAGDAGAAASAATGGHPARAGTAATQAGEAPGGAPGGSSGDTSSAGEGGTSSAGTAGSPGSDSLGLGGADGNPPVGDPPMCAQSAMYGAPEKLALSQTGDDLLEAITPDELTIAWKHGSDFFVADRAHATDGFGAPLQVTGGSAYTSVTLRVDGRQLLAVTKDLSIVQLTRQAGEAFNATSADPGDFTTFNATLSSIPVSGQVLNDAIASADEVSFFVSHYTKDATGSYASVLESRRTGATWPFPSADLGKVLYASGVNRRVPTGISSDRLTLFYRDDVQGDFRAAWRINPDVHFKHSEVIPLGNGAQSAVPNGACSKIYFSAQGPADLDLFVSPVTH